ncbi:MAG TPA: hypothetical protein VMP01_20795 [Pirellulaceae bacterium]|nr:hypothetical protein [Pirellulaceae bacterium]
MNVEHPYCSGKEEESILASLCQFRAGSEYEVGGAVLAIRPNPSASLGEHAILVELVPNLLQRFHYVAKVIAGERQSRAEFLGALDEKKAPIPVFHIPKQRNGVPVTLANFELVRRWRWRTQCTGGVPGRQVLLEEFKHFLYDVEFRNLDIDIPRSIQLKKPPLRSITRLVHVNVPRTSSAVGEKSNGRFDLRYTRLGFWFHLSLADRLRQLVSLHVNSYVISATVDLNVPVVWLSRMGSVLDPDSPLRIHVTPFAFLRAVTHFGLLDNQISAAVFCDSGDKWKIATSRQSGIVDLPVDLA